MVADLVNVKDGAKMYTIEGMFGFWMFCLLRGDAIVVLGGQGYMSVVLTTASRISFQFSSSAIRAATFK
jgi:hypothetical protein